MPGGRDEPIQASEIITKDPKEAARVLNLAKIGMTLRDIADVMRIPMHKLREFYQDEVDQGRAAMRQNLRMAQFKKAAEGDTRMLIWLGKQYLGQSEKLEAIAGALGDEEEDGPVEFIHEVIHRSVKDVLEDEDDDETDATEEADPTEDRDYD